LKSQNYNGAEDRTAAKFLYKDHVLNGLNFASPVTVRPAWHTARSKQNEEDVKDCVQSKSLLK